MFKLLKQPRGFSIFFLTEMWERYGFYITQTLLIFYLIEHFHLTDSISYSILGSFTALAYINPALGGYIADRFLGAKKAILWGAVLISLGYFILTFSEHLIKVFVSLSIISIGTGLLKPNISSLLGSLYSAKDSRRHTGYTLFYMGISLGIILATSFGGYLRQLLGWKITYINAALVLLVAWITFFWGSRFYNFDNLSKIEYSLKKYLLAFFFIILTMIINSIIITYQTLAIVAFSLFAIFSAIIMLYEIYNTKDSVEKKRLLAYLLLICISVFFWAMYFQLFFSMNLFIERVVDRQILGFKVPASFFVSIESFGLIIFGPFLGALWHLFARNNRGLSIPGKFASGLCMMTIAFVILFISSLFTDSNGLVMSGWIIVVYLIISIGELMLSPIGLAMVSELAPPRLAGLMMGIFFVSLGLGGKLAGIFADYAAISKNIGDLDQMKAIYHHAFGLYLLVCLIITLVSLTLVRIIKKLIVI